MRISLAELSFDQVVGINQRVILDAHRKDISSQQKHSIVRPNDLRGCLDGIFYQSGKGYQHLPLEKMAGLILYRISQGQYFLDGNKRTAVVSTSIFCRNHGLKLRLERAEVNDLVWGFAKGADGAAAKYDEDDAVRFVFGNVIASQ